MTIETKYDVGDQVVAIVNNEVHLTKVLAISVAAKTYEGGYKDEDIIYTIAVEDRDAYFSVISVRPHPNARRVGSKLFTRESFMEMLTEKSIWITSESL